MIRLNYIQAKENKELIGKGPIAKNIDFSMQKKLIDELKINEGDAIFLICDQKEKATKFSEALKDKATIDGFDVQMQTNHLSHFLLTKLCMPLLDKASQLRNEARIVNHSSIARTQAKKLKE